MTHSHHSEPAPDIGHLDRFPALAGLGLTEGDFAELAHQGYLAPERRQAGTYYKLRFRRGIGRRQVVRYVGGAEQAALVAEELKTLQTAHRMQRELDKLGCAVRWKLRDAKATLEPLLLERGFKFHGRAIRRMRRHGKPINVTFPTPS